MLAQVGFVIAAIAMLASAFKVVTTKNLVHMVLWLGLTLANTAVLFIMLDAAFLAAIQIILYTGGVLTLMLFGVMLTHRDAGFTGIANPSHRIGPGLVLAVAVFSMVAAAVLRTPIAPAADVALVTTADLGVALFGEHVLAFEVLSLLLLGAVLGAIVLARKRDAGDEREAPVIKRRKPAGRASVHSQATGGPA